MKKIYFVLGICLCTSWPWAQSTCETRVDAHQQASTVQRVRYCLADDSERPSVHNPAMVFSGVSSPKEQNPVQPTKQDDSEAHASTFKPKQVGISKVFVETRQFPKLDDGRISQQEIYAKQKALLEGKEMALAAIIQSECVLPEETVAEEEPRVPNQKASAPRTTAKPARQTKRVRKKSITKTVVETTQPEKVQEEIATNSTLADAFDSAPQGQDIPVGTASYAPVEMAYEEYVPVESEEIPVGTASYAPAN